MRKLAAVLCAMLTTQCIDAQQTDNTILSDSSKPIVLDEVTVRSKKPFVQLLPDKTIINVDAAATNAGATLMEVLEKSPGVTVDRNGNISLKGRQGILIMIDGKPAQTSGADLNNLLTGMAASQVDQIEIVDNPSARYDAAGNAGIINIKTKKNKQKGFNGNINVAVGHGRYARTLNNLTLNYNTGRVNAFANVTGNYNQNFTDLYAIRSYYADDKTTVLSMMEQPSYFRGKAPSQSIKTGIDYYIGKKTIAGLVFTNPGFQRTSRGRNPAIWMDANGNTDSVIVTTTRNKDKLKNFSVNLNAKHSFSASRELSVDFDFLGYRIHNEQFYNNTLEGNTGYDEDIIGDLPANINILTGKADYSQVLANGYKLETGWKSSYIKTNNKAQYFTRIENVTTPDYGKTNHFIYEEHITAAYINSEKKFKRWLLQAGLRYENTSYDANQLGNVQRKDSAFSRNYDGLFPTATASFEADSNHVISFTVGRRIDRPAFQSLNPFIFVINKYTYEAGNPFYRPQYTWNFEISHTFTDMIVTSLNYSNTKDYFSQIFLQDSTGIITYTVGNLDKMVNYGLSVSFQSAITRWWSVSAMTALNRKIIDGFVWNQRRTARTQANFNLNNQFLFGKGWSGEVSGFYQLHEQELQEITDPTGQIGIGLSKQVLKNRGSLKFSFRDIFYTQAMKGFTVFEQSTEYFKLTRDSRAATLSFTYRFGSQTKSTRRNTGGAEEEINRVGGQG